MKRTRYIEEQERALKKLSNRIYDRSINEKKLYPLILANPERTLPLIRRIGILYHCVQNSIRYNQFKRAVWYLGVMERDCVRLSQISEKIVKTE